MVNAYRAQGKKMAALDLGGECSLKRSLGKALRHYREQLAGRLSTGRV
jgi:hypothetical protein